MREVPLIINDQVSLKNPVAGRSKRVPRYKIALAKEPGSVYVTSKPITSPAMILTALQELFEDIDREAFYVVCLDSASKIIGVNLVSVGTLSASLVHPREVFKAAILLNAYSILCVHNHPGGALSPSREDRELTSRLEDAGKLMGIFVRDHVIVTDEGYFSFNEYDLMRYTV